MKRLISAFLLLVAFCSAFAQSTPEVNEHASPMTVIIFLVLFVGSCVGYFVYIWWGRRKTKGANIK